jgi:hypothetical protein
LDQPAAHAAGLSAGLVKVAAVPADSGTCGELAELVLPGVDSLEDGMLFAASSTGGSDVNIVGVAPKERHRLVLAIREDSENTAEAWRRRTSRVQFLYVPFDAAPGRRAHCRCGRLERKAVRGFHRRAHWHGTYEITIPGKIGTGGTLLLQVGCGIRRRCPMDRVPSSRTRSVTGSSWSSPGKTTSDTAADLADASFMWHGWTSRRRSRHRTDRACGGRWSPFRARAW